MSPGPRHSLWHSSDGGQQPAAGAFPPLVILRLRLQNRCGEMGNDNNPPRAKAGGWPTAASYPAETPPPPLAPSTDDRSDSANLGEPLQEGRLRAIPQQEQVGMGGTSWTALRRYRLALASSSSGEMAVADPRSGRKPLFQKPISGGVRQQSSFSPSPPSWRSSNNTPSNRRLQRLPRFRC